MNRRRREILQALVPAEVKALGAIAHNVYGEDSPLATRPKRDVPGLHLRPRAESGETAELLIYGRIGGGGWFSEGISAADVAALLREAGPGPVNVRINSPGGDVFDGVAIHSLLARHPGTVTTYVDGLAASAASFIMLAGDRIVSARNAFVMIHDAMTVTYGNGNTHRDTGELLDKVSDNIADMYAERAGEDAAHWRDLMTVNGEDGTWYTGQEALDAGLVDELTASTKGEDEDEDVAAKLSGWSAFLPEKILSSLKLPTEPVEDAVPAWDAAKTQQILKEVFA